MKSLKAVALLLFFGIFYLLPLDGRPLWQPDETRYAEISREMLARGDWVVPRLLDLRYFEKPVAGYWLNSLSQWLFGDGNMAARLAPALSTALSAALVFWLALSLWSDRRKAWAACLIYLSCFLVYAIGTYNTLDSILTLWLNAAMVGCHAAISASSPRRKITASILAGLACGMAFLTKGFLALVIPVIVVTPFMLWRRRIGEFFANGLIMIAAAAMISAPWAIAIAMQEPDYWHYFFWVEHIQRFAADNAQHKEPFWFFVPILMAGVMPWLGLLPSALAGGWRQRREQPALLYLLLWAAMPFLFFSIARGKLPTYILPCFAPLALLMAHAAIGKLDAGHLRVFTVNGWINGVAGLLVALAVAGLLLAGKRSPYSPDEYGRVLLLSASFAAWAVAGWWALRQNARRWWLAALCPLMFGLAGGGVLPEKVRATKQPQYLIDGIRSELAGSRYILSNNVGIAAGVAWETKRSDVLMLGKKGELDYGLDYADSTDRFVPAEQFAEWLAAARREGDVSLLLLDGKPDELPAPDRVVTPKNGSSEDRLFFLYYRRKP